MSRGLAFYLHTFIEKTFMTAKFLLLLVSSALHHHTDDNVSGTDVTMPRVRWVKFIYVYSQICTIDKISKLFPFCAFIYTVNGYMYSSMYFI